MQPGKAALLCRGKGAEGFRLLQKIRHSFFAIKILTFDLFQKKCPVFTTKAISETTVLITPEGLHLL